MVKAVREAEKIVGKINYNLTDKQINSKVFGRSLFVVNDIRKGDLLSEENVRSIRPGFGIHPKHLYEIIGKKAKTDIPKGTPLSFDLISE